MRTFFVRQKLCLTKTQTATGKGWTKQTCILYRHRMSECADQKCRVPVDINKSIINNNGIPNTIGQFFHRQQSTMWNAFVFALFLTSILSFARFYNYFFQVFSAFLSIIHLAVQIKRSTSRSYCVWYDEPVSERNARQPDLAAIITTFPDSIWPSVCVHWLKFRFLLPIGSTLDDIHAHWT